MKKLIYWCVLCCSLARCGSSTSETKTDSTTSPISKRTETASSSASFKSLIADMDARDKALPAEYCELLGIVPCLEFNTITEIKAIDNKRYLLPLLARTGATAITTQAQVILMELTEDKVINQNFIELNYQSAPTFSLHHNTFFLVEMEMKEYEENDAGAMSDTGKPPTIERECRALFNGKIASLQELTKPELLLCRNLIFARHGYQFKLDSLREYFSKFDWYKPVSKDVNDQLTAEDKILIDLILKAEATKSQ